MKAALRALARCVLLLLPLLVGLGCYALENFLNPQAAAEFTTGLQFVVGNFPTSSTVNPQNVWFSLAVAFRFGLAYAPSYGAALVFMRLLRLKKEQTMKFVELLRDQNLAIEQEILNIIPLEQRDQFRSQLEKAIETAADRWADRYLPILVGGNEAAHRTLQTEVRTPRAS